MNIEYRISPSNLRVGRVGQPTYEPLYLPVILQISPTSCSPKTISRPPESVKLEDQLRKWVESGQSLAQIAEHLGASKTWVIEQLRKFVIVVPKTGRMTNPENYRHHITPFGYKKKGGKLVPCQKQQRACRRVVQLRKSESMSFNAIAKKLRNEGYKNSAGTQYWDHKAVKKIFEAWKEKY